MYPNQSHHHQLYHVTGALLDSGSCAGFDLPFALIFVPPLSCSPMLLLVLEPSPVAVEVEAAPKEQSVTWRHFAAPFFFPLNFSAPPLGFLQALLSIYSKYYLV